MYNLFQEDKNKTSIPVRAAVRCGVRSCTPQPHYSVRTYTHTSDLDHYNIIISTLALPYEYYYYYYY